ncbi:MAG: hypothetical protein AB7H66_11365 [Hyphomonadaceae bacterium]
MRTLILALALLAAACSPPAQDTEPAPENPYIAALTAASPPGAWAARTDEGTTSVCFGEFLADCAIDINCTMGMGHITISIEQQPRRPANQDVTVRFFTATQTLDVGARTWNQEGLPNVLAGFSDGDAEKDPFIDMLSTPTERFGVEIGNTRTVFPWDASVASVLTACR